MVNDCLASIAHKIIVAIRITDKQEFKPHKKQYAAKKWKITYSALLELQILDSRELGESKRLLANNEQLLFQANVVGKVRLKIS